MGIIGEIKGCVSCNDQGQEEILNYLKERVKPLLNDENCFYTAEIIIPGIRMYSNLCSPLTQHCKIF